MVRKNPIDSQKKRLLEANAFRCCVCKRSDIGFNFHHLDGDSANTIDQNLAVLCLEDHDKHHRPGEYISFASYLELNEAKLRSSKISWEAFVTEARKPNPTVLATLSCYGTKELIHSLQLVMQWSDERIEYAKSFHLLDANLDQLTDKVLMELASISPNMKMAFIDAPLPVEHCPCCGVGFSRTMKPAVVAKLTDPRWETESLCCIYINPDQPSLALLFFLGEQELFAGYFHLCQGLYLHYSTDGIDERIPIKPKLSTRTQATQVIEHLLDDWNPARVLIGTGNSDTPRIISEFHLPAIWESGTVKKVSQQIRHKRRN